LEIKELSKVKKYSNVSVDRLLTYLSDIVLTKTDEEIKLKQQELDGSRSLFKDSKERLKEVKNRLNIVSKEEDRLTNLYKVLNTVQALKQEGTLVGKNRIKVLNLLGNIDNYNTKSLKNLQKKLDYYLPDNESRNFFLNN